MEVFIENEAHKTQKNLFDEKTLEFKKTVEVSAPYPFAYGFVLNTTSGDGDNLDCFVITGRVLNTGDRLNVRPIGLLEMYEDGELDHKVIAGIDGEGVELTKAMKTEIVDFLNSVFSHIPGKKMEVGDFKDSVAALELLNQLRD